ncbi:phosphotyrosine protein phosphatase [Streptomyces sp. NPDC008265]|uniref:phosphotyrosine protein phosphatase n=1 Tax=Streptomyces sp. NPDC008265 TaxID=3364824 RepID=UPI0036EA4C01
MRTAGRDPASGAEVEDAVTRPEVRDRGGVPAPEGGGQGSGRQVVPVVGRVQRGAEAVVDLHGLRAATGVRSFGDLAGSDVVITMGCGDACPYFPGKRYLDWTLQDPAGQGVEAVRPIRDEIRRRIRDLIAELDAASPLG